MENSTINDLASENQIDNINPQPDDKPVEKSPSEQEVMKPINQYFNKDYDEVVDWFENDYQNFSI